MNLVVQLGTGTASVGVPVKAAHTFICNEPAARPGMSAVSPQLGLVRSPAIIRSQVHPILMNSSDRIGYGSALTAGLLNRIDCSPPAASRKISYQQLSHSNHHGYSGLPYQDHNYMAPLPCTPPQSPLLSSAPLPQVPNRNNNNNNNTNGCNTSVMSSTGVVSNIVIDDVSCHTTVSTSSALPSVTSSSLTLAMDDSVTRCICDFQHDDGYMICCDRCAVWQHVDCMRVDRSNIPENYLCEKCEPRKVDKHRAILIQTRKRDDLSFLPVDSSTTETEDETMDATTRPRKSYDKQSSSAVNSKKDDVGSLTGLSTIVNGNAAGPVLTQKKRMRKNRKDMSVNNNKKKWPIKNKKQHDGMIALCNGIEKEEKAASMVSSPCKLVASNHVSFNTPGGAFDDLVAAALNIEKYSNSPPDLPARHAQLSPPPLATSQSSSKHRSISQSFYELPVANVYSKELQDLLGTIRCNSMASSWRGSPSSKTVRSPLSSLRSPSVVSCLLPGDKMGLQATEDIVANQLLIEYTGNVQLRDQYVDNDLFFSTYQPHVLFYNKFNGLDLCVNASSHDGDGRFIRRSCTPNAEVRHVLEGSMLRFFIHATKSIIRGAEVTIPFDFNYHKCNYVVECACSRVSCPVIKHQRGTLSSHDSSAVRKHRSSRSIETLEENKIALPIGVPETNRKPSPSAPPPPLPLAAPLSARHRRRSTADDSKQEPADGRQHPVLKHAITKTNEVLPTVGSVRVKTELSCMSPRLRARMSSAPCTAQPTGNSLQGGSGAHHHRRDSEQQKPIRFSSTGLSMTNGAAASAANNLSASDSDDGEKSKKMTREEKKLEAIMKAFERLEKREERRKDYVSKKPKEESLQQQQPHSSSPSSDTTATLNNGVTDDQTMSTSLPMKEEMHAVNSEDNDNPEIKIEPSPVPTVRGRKRKFNSGVRRGVNGCVKTPIKRELNDDEDSNQAEAAATLVALASGCPLTPMSLPQSSHSTVSITHNNAHIQTPLAASSPQLNSSYTLNGSSLADRYISLPKKLQMKVGSSDVHRPLVVCTDALDLDVGGGRGGGVEEGALGMMPSPIGIVSNHFRRASVSGDLSSSSSSSAVATAAMMKGGSLVTTPQPADSNNRGFAKKALLDNTGMPSCVAPISVACLASPRHSPAMNEYTSSISPAISPVGDLVAPLKKRRLARESMSEESLLPSLASGNLISGDKGRLEGNNANNQCDNSNEQWRSSVAVISDNIPIHQYSCAISTDADLHSDNQSPSSAVGFTGTTPAVALLYTKTNVLRLHSSEINVISRTNNSVHVNVATADEDTQNDAICNIHEEGTSVQRRLNTMDDLNFSAGQSLLLLAQSACTSVLADRGANEFGTAKNQHNSQQYAVVDMSVSNSQDLQVDGNNEMVVSHSAVVELPVDEISLTSGSTRNEAMRVSTPGIVCVESSSSRSVSRHNIDPDNAAVGIFHLTSDGVGSSVPCLARNNSSIGSIADMNECDSSNVKAGSRVSLLNNQFSAAAEEQPDGFDDYDSRDSYCEYQCQSIESIYQPNFTQNAVSSENRGNEPLSSADVEHNWFHEILSSQSADTSVVQKELNVEGSHIPSTSSSSVRVRVYHAPVLVTEGLPTSSGDITPVVEDSTADCCNVSGGNQERDTLSSYSSSEDEETNNYDFGLGAQSSRADSHILQDDSHDVSGLDQTDVTCSIDIESGNAAHDQRRLSDVGISDSSTPDNGGTASDSQQNVQWLPVVSSSMATSTSSGVGSTRDTANSSWMPATVAGSMGGIISQSTSGAIHRPGSTSNMDNCEISSTDRWSAPYHNNDPYAISSPSSSYNNSSRLMTTRNSETACNFVTHSSNSISFSSEVSAGAHVECSDTRSNGFTSTGQASVTDGGVVSSSAMTPLLTFTDDNRRTSSGSNTGYVEGISSTSTSSSMLRLSNDSVTPPTSSVSLSDISNANSDISSSLPSTFLPQMLSSKKKVSLLEYRSRRLCRTMVDGAGGALVRVVPVQQQQASSSFSSESVDSSTMTSSSPFSSTFRTSVTDGDKASSSGVSSGCGVGESCPSTGGSWMLNATAAEQTLEKRQQQATSSSSTTVYRQETGPSNVFNDGVTSSAPASQGSVGTLAGSRDVVTETSRHSPCPSTSTTTNKQLVATLSCESHLPTTSNHNSRQSVPELSSSMTCQNSDQISLHNNADVEQPHRQLDFDTSDNNITATAAGGSEDDINVHNRYVCPSNGQVGLELDLDLSSNDFVNEENGDVSPSTVESCPSSSTGMRTDQRDDDDDKEV